MTIWVRPPKLAQAYARQGLSAREDSPRSGPLSELERARSIIAGAQQNALDANVWFQGHQAGYEKAAARAARQGITLREAAPKEPAIRAWWAWGGDPMWQAAEDAIASAPQTNPLRFRTTTKPHEGFIVRAYEGRKKVGQMLVVEQLNDMWVQNVEVLEPYRGRGYGRQLYREAARVACAEWGKPLSSKSWAASPHARGLWRSEVRRGVAVKTEDGFAYDCRMLRQQNPSWLMLGVATLTAFTAGAAGTFRGLGGNPDALDPGEYIELEEYEGAILLFPTAETWVGRTVDYFTGEKGFSHVALDVGLVNADGEPLYLDSWATDGVNIRSPGFFDRDPIRYPLTPQQAAHARSVGLHLLHSRTPYRGRRGGKTCSEFVAACLPRSFIRKLHLPRDPTPNDLAMALGLAQIAEAQ